VGARSVRLALAQKTRACFTQHMSLTCDQCRTRIRNSGNQTPTRLLCDNCYSTFAGLTGGLITGGTVENAVSTSGWLSALRKPKKDQP